MERITNRKQLKEWLVYEKEKLRQKSFFHWLAMYIMGHEPAVIWRFQRRMRITEYHYNTGHKLRYVWNFFLFNHARNRYGFQIGLNTCGKGLKLMHLGSILINKNARLGEDVSIHINTAIVAHGLSNQVPTIGNRVVIGVGSTILGGIEIADGIAIGANSVVNKSFLEGDIAIAGVPAKKISDNGSSCWNKKSSN